MVRSFTVTGAGDPTPTLLTLQQFEQQQPEKQRSAKKPAARLTSRMSLLDSWLPKRLQTAELIQRGIATPEDIAIPPLPPLPLSSSASAPPMLSPSGPPPLLSPSGPSPLLPSPRLKPSSSSSSPSYSPSSPRYPAALEDGSEWSSRVTLPPQWPADEIAADHHQQEGGLLDVTAESLSQGWHYEHGTPGAPSSPALEIVLRDLDREFYKEFIASYPHVHFIGESEGMGPVVISATKPADPTARQPLRVSHVLVRTQTEDHRFLVAKQKKTSLIRSIQAAFPPLGGLKFAKIGGSEEMRDRLQQFDQDQMCSNYKFGVLLCAPGQRDEDAMFGNIDGPAEWERFLAFLGDRIRLKGWTKFRGGLDVKSDSTGTHSIYTNFFLYQIMYHVSTLLPWNPTDVQQLERKRHLGNDIVVLIFLADPARDRFDPQVMASHFNHTYVVVSPHGPSHFRVAIANKPGVPPYSPVLPHPAIIPADAAGRRFLMAKLINAERIATVHTPTFREKTKRTRKMLLSTMIQEIFLTKPLKSSGIRKMKAMGSTPNMLKRGT